MCGIVGYIGNKNATPILLDGLSKLEYRGYDSAGIAVQTEKEISIIKAKGRLQTLRERVDQQEKVVSHMGIGHTRWATHGAPSDINSHPHVSMHGTIAVVHNGIIENFMQLKSELEAQGYVFVSETDTEVVAHLFESVYEGDLVDAMIKTINRLEGSFALGILAKDHSDAFVAVRKDSPLIVGLSPEGNFIASDIPAILEHTRDIYLLNDDEIVLLKQDRF
jgi:glucosamine--fructose-6-phosphate aminotransferase (isomerizing)